MVRQIPAKLLARLLAEQTPIYLVDVRQPWEHETAALPDQLFLPLDQLADRVRGHRRAHRRTEQVDQQEVARRGSRASIRESRWSDLACLE